MLAFSYELLFFFFLYRLEGENFPTQARTFAALCQGRYIAGGRCNPNEFINFVTTALQAPGGPAPDTPEWTPNGKVFDKSPQNIEAVVKLLTDDQGIRAWNTQRAVGGGFTKMWRDARKLIRKLEAAGVDVKGDFALKYVLDQVESVRAGQQYTKLKAHLEARIPGVRIKTTKKIAGPWEWTEVDWPETYKANPSVTKQQFESEINRFNRDDTPIAQNSENANSRHWATLEPIQGLQACLR